MEQNTWSLEEVDLVEQKIYVVPASPYLDCQARCEISDWPLPPGILQVLGYGSLDKWWILQFKEEFRMDLDNSTHIVTSGSDTFTIESPGMEQIRVEHSLLYSSSCQTKLLFVVEGVFVVAYDRDACVGKVVLTIRHDETVWYGNRALCRGRFFVKRNSVYFEEIRYSIGKALDIEQISCRHVMLTDDPNVVALFQGPSQELSHY